MMQRADLGDTRQARRLADMVGMVRIVLISLIAVGTLMAVTANGGLLAIICFISGAVAAACVYVVLGCLEQILLLLVRIAHDTEQARLSPRGQEG